MADGLSGDGLSPPRAGGFLSGLIRIDTGDEAQALVLAEVSPDDFSDAAFDAHGFARPPLLDRAVPGRRAGWLSGRIAARAACAELGRPLEALPGDEEGVPVWPLGLTGSISHTPGCAAALVAGGTRCLGVDVEHVPEGARLSALRARALLPPERESLPEPWQATLGFSAKECLFKALYPGLRIFFGFDAAEVTALGHNTLDLRLTRDLSRTMRSGRTFRAHWRREESTVLVWLAG